MTYCPMFRKINLSFVFIFLIAVSANANVRLPKLFGDNMVLQRDKPIPIWGWADPNEKVTVQFNNQNKSIKAGKDGSWKLNLDMEKAGGPFNLVVTGKNKISINNVLVGDVWICSGQSNMEWPLRNTKDADKEIKSANFPLIRHTNIAKDVSEKPLKDLKEAADWKLATPEFAGNFTAVGYYFAKELYKELNIPIGLIHTSWGGTDIETWISREGFEGSDEFKTMIENIPSIDLEAVSKKKKEELFKKVTNLQGGLPDKATVDKWKDPNFDDSKWKELHVPGLWESQSLADFDGVVWYRKRITLGNGVENGGVLELASIDDSDETFVNGVKVGSTLNQYSAKRTYIIPPGVLKTGGNTIAVRVTDTGGGGGIFGEASDVKLTADKKEQSLAGNWKYAIESLQEGSGSVGPNTYPSLLYNAMISPLIPYAFKGAIWYQGENNSGRAFQYRKAFPLMINDWRKHWGQGDSPFYFVQLASFNAANGNSQKGSTWAELREAQTLTLQVPNTGMAITTDIGEPNDIHPRNKKDVGFRLAAIALKNTYNKDIVSEGPAFSQMKLDGDKANIFFKNIGNGLFTKDKYGYIRGFEVAGADQKFYYARAFIEGDHIVVTSDAVASPVAVRYNWADDASDGNLYNKEGFPAAPFRTDTWKGITEEAKYRK
jgi:sialate O-acetylesterase